MAHSAGQHASGGGGAGGFEGATSATSASHAPNSHLQRPGPAPTSGSHFNKGHQRRQSVARLLPDISKLRLLSWLVEASNELINCDIAIMDGVYAKLNRSRESLLFWQQSQQVAVASPAASRPPPPPPPAVGPVANKIVISQQQQQQQQAQQKPRKGNMSVGGSKRHHSGGKDDNLGRNKSNSLASSAATSKGAAQATASQRLAAGATRNHHSLPAANYDASSLAALSLRSNKQLKAAAAVGIAADDCETAAAAAAGEPQSIASASIMMMQQNLMQQQRAASTSASGNTAGRLLPPRDSCDTKAGHEPSDFCDHHNHGNLSDEEDDEDDNSSAASSTASSGIHGASMSSSVSSSSSSSSSSTSSSSSSSSSSSTTGGNSDAASSSSASTSSAASVDSFEGRTAARQQQERQQQRAHAQRDLSQLSPAEQLSERIRRAVMDHNYLQNLLVNIIRQHDRRRDLFNMQRAAQAHGRLFSGQPQQQQPRIDLADIADALDDGCQCTCHAARLCASSRRQQLHQESHDSFDEQSLSMLSTASAQSTGGGGGGKRASTLPSSSTLSLFQAPQSLVPAVVARTKNRRKKNAQSELSREDLLRKLADRLCESCFETHYWLSGCSSIDFSPLQTQSSASPQQHKQSKTCSTSLKANNNGGGGGGADHQDHSLEGQSGGNTLSSSLDLRQQQQQQQQQQQTKSHQSGGQREQEQLDAIVSLRNATFIKLVQQQVRAVISGSIELIDLIRKEIKSPESIKQKQLMRCFSASIQLLSSVANYVVPAQDISTFIPAEIMGQSPSPQQQHHHHHHHQQQHLHLHLGGHFGSGRHAAASQQAATSLFNLPPADFDHLLMYPAPLASSYGHRLSLQQQQAVATNYHLASAPEIPMRRRQAAAAAAAARVQRQQQRRSSDEAATTNSLLSAGLCQEDSLSFQDEASFRSLPPNCASPLRNSFDVKSSSRFNLSDATSSLTLNETTSTNPNASAAVESSSGASSNNSSASSSIARNQVAQLPSSLSLSSGPPTSGSKRPSQNHPRLNHHHQQQQQQQKQQQQQQQQRHELPFDAFASHLCQQQNEYDLLSSLHPSRAKFWQSSKFNFIKKLLQVKQQRLLRQQSKDRRIYNNKVQNKFRLVMMDLTHFNKSQQLLATENGVNSLLTSMRNVLEFGLYLTVKLY